MKPAADTPLLAADTVVTIANFTAAYAQVFGGGISIDASGPPPAKLGKRRSPRKPKRADAQGTR